jgi:hypothetical protein
MPIEEKKNAEIQRFMRKNLTAPGIEGPEKNSRF